MTERKGDWFQTVSGRVFWPFDPRPEDVTLEDVAHALAMECRFGNHTPTFYSVAQHSVLVSRLVAPSIAMYGLLHDAHEAYMGDMTRPVKNSMGQGLTNYTLACGRVQKAIEMALGVVEPDWGTLELVKLADNIALATEKRDLLVDGPGKWKPLPPPAHETIKPWTFEWAREAFMFRFREIKAWSA